MTRTMLFALAATTTAVAGSYLYGQGTPVNLQPTTPGTQQVGNANVSGRIIASSVHVADPTPSGQAIVGSATSTTGANFGGFFRSDSVLGRALYGRASATSGTTHGVWGQADSPGGRGVTGLAPSTSGNATGVWGQTASTTGRGVYGFTTANSGVNYGVYGQSSSPAGFGVYSFGKMHATGVISGNGSGLTGLDASSISTGTLNEARLPVPMYLWGSNNVNGLLTVENTSAAGGARAIFGLVSGNEGGKTGVVGLATNNQGTGVRGQGNYGVEAWGTSRGLNALASSSTGTAVQGYASGTGKTSGGMFESISSATDSAGVVGMAYAGTGITYGVWGQSASTSAFATIGIAPAASGTTYGIYGRTTSTAGWSVFADGRFGASGTKSFRIDHPLDPENKYLLHYSSESPTPQNFYVGNVVTDAQGYAWVDLPDYFSEINKNFKYQLTVVDDADGDDFVMAKVSKEIREGRFQIRTSSPKTKVSWRVDADRNDLFVRNRPAKDVEQKIGVEQGRYQHPEFYGFGPERGVKPGGGPSAMPPTPTGPLISRPG